MRGIMVGTGVDKFAAGPAKGRVETKWGPVDWWEKDGMAVIPRHGQGHKTAPSKINYKANMSAFAEIGCDCVCGTYAVGSITSRYPPASIFLVEDFLDFTGRDISLRDGVEGPLEHVGMVRPFDPALCVGLMKAAVEDGVKMRPGCVYATTNGPRLETAAEIRALRAMGADVVGMTLGTEAALARELGIRFAAVAYSINWAAGLDEEGVSFLEDESVARLSSKVLGIISKALQSV